MASNAIRKIRVPDLDGVGGTLHLTYRDGNPDNFKFDGYQVQWDIDRDNPIPDSTERERRRSVVESEVSKFVDQSGNLAFVYDQGADDHLRIYGHPRGPDPSKTLANRPPIEFDFGNLKLRSVAGPDLVTYYHGDLPVTKREFSRVAGTVQIEGEEVPTLTTTETISWARNDGTWVTPPPSVNVYTGTEEIDLITSARRAKAYNRLRDEFRAYNLGRVRSGEIDPATMGAWLRSTECQEIFDSLRLLDFGTAATQIDAMSGAPATAAFKAAWIAKLQAEL